MDVGWTEICRDSPETRKPPSGGYLRMCLTRFLVLPGTQPLVIDVVISTVTLHGGYLRQALPRVHFTGLLVLPRTFRQMAVISVLVKMLSVVPTGNLC